MSKIMEPSAIGVSLGVEVLKRTAPSGLDWLTTYLGGIELLIVGPGGAGKTSIAEYLEYGILEKLQPHEKTLEISTSKTFKIAFGRDESLKMRVRRAVDVPGQTGPVQHADLVREKRPHVLLIVLDGSNTAPTLSNWLEPFCERLNYLYRSDKRLLSKKRGIFVALNKRDAVRRKMDHDARVRHVRAKLQAGLVDLLGKQEVNSIPIMPTISVETKQGSSLLDTLIRKIAKKVRK